MNLSRLALISTKQGAALPAGTVVIQAAQSNKRPFVSFAKLTKGVLDTCDLQIGGRTVRSDGADGEALFVGAVNEPIEVVVAGIGSDASYLLTFGLLDGNVAGTGS